MQIEASPGKAALWAIVAAAALLVTVILPAEYGIDPIGAGRVLGLTAMGQQKVAAAKAARAPEATMQEAPAAPLPAPLATASKRPLRADAVEIALPPQGEVEYKTVLAEGESIVYEWDAGGAQLKFDFHGEPTAGPEGAFLTFEKGTASRGAGSLKAPFTGTHGWYWKNTGAAPVVIRLKASGFHSELKRL